MWRRPLGAPGVEAVCGKLSQVSGERAFVVGVFPPVEGLALQHAVSIEQLLMTLHQPAERVGSFDLAAAFVHTAITVHVAALGVCLQEDTFPELPRHGIETRQRRSRYMIHRSPRDEPRGSFGQLGGEHAGPGGAQVDADFPHSGGDFGVDVRPGAPFPRSARAPSASRRGH